MNPPTGAATQIYSLQFDRRFFGLPERTQIYIQFKIDELGRNLRAFPHHRMQGVDANRGFSGPLPVQRGKERTDINHGWKQAGRIQSTVELKFPSQRIAAVNGLGGISHGDRKNLFFIQALLRVRHAGAHLLMSEPIVTNDFVLGPALCHEPKNEFHGETGAPDHRFADQHSGIGCDIVLPVHTAGNISRRMPVASAECSVVRDRW